MQLKLKRLIWTTILAVCLIVAMPGIDRADAFAASGLNDTSSLLAGASEIKSPEVGLIVAIDRFRSAFTIGGKAGTSVIFRNDGSATKLEFAISNTSAGWEITLADSSGPLKLLPNTHFESNFAVASGASYSVVVTARAVSLALTEGNFVSPVLDVYPAGGSKSDSCQLRFAIPAPFVYAVSDSQRKNSLRLAYLSPNASIEAIELLSFAGTNLAVSSARINENKYVLAWENRISLQNPAQNIEFSIYNNVGTGLVHRKTLFDNSVSINVDSAPFIGASPNGKFGILFNRKINNSTTNQIAFQLVNQDGSNVNNALVPLVVKQEDNFLIAPRLIGLPVESGQFRMLAVWYNFAHELWGASINITNDTNVATQYGPSPLDSDASWPVILPLSDGRVFLAYNKGVNTILANDMQFNLAQPDPPKSISGTAPIPRGAVQFSNGNILLAWTDYDQVTDKDQVKLSLFNATVSTDPVPVNLDFNNILEPIDVSITLDRQGRAIVFWTDSMTHNFLYYALVDSSGTVVTPPMFFRESRGDYEFIIGPNGQGIVGLNGLFGQYLPNIAR